MPAPATYAAEQPSPGPYPAIADYGIIGDCRSAALVSKNGSLEWLCWPRFDSTSVFAALLDRERGGFWKISPIPPYSVRREYVTNTNVLQTYFTTASGRAVLTNLMPVRQNSTLVPDHEIIRRLACESGEMEVELVLVALSFTLRQPRLCRFHPNKEDSQMNPLRQLTQLGQSIWLDYIRRDLITSGQLQRLIDEDGISGITSNPTIFAKALAGDSEYDSAVQAILHDSPDLDTSTIFERIETQDLQMAADALRPIYDRTDGNDGFVSIEVSPHLAYETKKSVAEARRLWTEVGRKNLMVKIPATSEGLPAIEYLIAEGINVNITLMFSVSQYEDVAHAYLRGMERNRRPHEVTSVASFFVSRVDTAVDRALEEVGTPEALALRGKAGIANAKLAYRRFRQIFSGPKFERIKARGVRLQKPLWASTGTKNKAYSDVMYIEGLAGPDTINSIPPETLEAFRDHGKPRVALGQNEDEAEEVVGKLLEMGINPRSVGQELTEQGVEKFIQSYDELIHALDKKRAALARTEAA